MINYIRDRLILLKAGVVYTFQQDFAYWANNWGNILSGTSYAIITIVFINILFSNTKEIAGYDKDQMLFFTSIGQIVFYITVIFSFQNIKLLVEDINSGNLDMVLTKPVASLFYINTRVIDLFSVFRDYAPGFLAIFLSINFNNINLQIINLLFGIIIIVCGTICSHVIVFLFALTAFWVGESSSLVDLAYYAEFDVVEGIPFEGFGFSKKLQIGLITLFPALIGAGLSSSVILGKSEALPALVMSIIVCALALLVENLSWRIALRNYSSASS
jgi:ABC-type uncharacterized transport system permease subunit